MKKNAVLITILLTLVVLGIAHVGYYHPKLPDTVASHFNGKGEADGHSSKLTHSIMMISLQAGMAGMFLVIGAICKRLPPSLVNMPNREYWLAPERKEETIRKMNGGLFGLAIGTQVFFMGLNHLISLHNLGVPAMNWFWPVFAIYMAFVIGFCVWLCLKFKMPESENEEPPTANSDGSQGRTL